MALRVCTCRRHVRASDARCPFCGALTALILGTAAGVTCGGRTPLDANVDDASVDVSTSHDGSSDGGEKDSAQQTDGSASDASSPPDAAADVEDDSCAPLEGACTTAADCCQSWADCFDGRCVAALYGAPPPPK